MALCGAVLCCMLVCTTHGAYDLSDPSADHTEHAIEMDEAGDLGAAVASFRAAAKFAPKDAAHWLNLATALGDESFEARGEVHSKQERVRALRRALGHPHLAVLKMDCEGCEFTLARDILAHDPLFFGRVDQVVMRGIDVMMAFPAILLAICIVTVLGQSLLNLMVAVGIVATMVEVGTDR